MTYKYIIFDLDQTLYPKKSGLLPAIDRRIDEYMQMKLELPLEQIASLRQDYWLKYGTTIGGMILHHRIDPEEYLDFAYNIAVEDYIMPNRLLADVLRNIKLRRVVFSNSPRDYVMRVLKVLGIDDLMEAVYDIKFCNYLGKPNLSSYNLVMEDLKTSGNECIFVDDVWVNVDGAKRLGMTPVLLSSDQVIEAEWVISDILEIGRLLPEVIKQQRSA